MISSEPPISAAAIAPLIATVAPTEMSMPRVAITSVMPIAINITGAARLMMSITLPYKPPFTMRIEKKSGLNQKFTMTSRNSATSGQNSRLLVIP